MEEHPGVGLGQRRHRPEVAVVALPLAGDRRVHRVVEVVAPLRGEPVAARLAGGDQPGVVEVGLGDEDQLAVQPARRAPAPRRRAPRGSAAPGGLPARAPRPAAARPGGSRAATSARCRSGTRAPRRSPGWSRFTAGTPRRHVRVGEVRPEVGQPVADADVVVHHVEQDGQAARVAGVHEPLQPVRARRRARAPPTG